ncbi:MAG: RNase adapter RapZ [Alphaproteobacteria bacterium]|nr:RNase adapter RapZ [Alphaproteobacteria bacterium]
MVQPVVLVTGMSGAGRSTALKILEDLGYEAVDNLPLSLLNGLVRPGETDNAAQPLAIGVDIRTRDFAVLPVIEQLDQLTAQDGIAMRILFLDCDDDVLLRRYTETRRRHPLAEDRPVPDGIRLERRLLSRLRDRADAVIDTSDTTLWDLKDQMTGRFGFSDKTELIINVTSFSYRQGLPREADLVFDVRFLANPHYDQRLRPLTGEDADVGAFIAADPDFSGFLGHLKSMLDVLLPRYDKEGKSYLTIAIGCTGGRHRSVYIARRLVELLENQGRRINLHHRDLSSSGGQKML